MFSISFAARAARRSASTPCSSIQPRCFSSAATVSSTPSARAATVLTTGGRQSPGLRASPSPSMWLSSRTVASAPSRSALLTTYTSPISRIPAFAAWMPSPIPGASSTTLVSACAAMSTSDWPTPTVSTRITSQPAASSTRTACGAAHARPPRWPRVAIDRM
ncbi:hypothetical protein STAL104432_26180 [Streptomyces albus]